MLRAIRFQAESRSVLLSDPISHLGYRWVYFDRLRIGVGHNSGHTGSGSVWPTGVALGVVNDIPTRRVASVFIGSLAGLVAGGSAYERTVTPWRHVAAEAGCEASGSGEVTIDGKKQRLTIIVGNDRKKPDSSQPDYLLVSDSDPVPDSVRAASRELECRHRCLRLKRLQMTARSKAVTLGITPRLVDLRAGAVYLAVSYWTIRDYVLAGLLPVVELPPLRPREGERARKTLRRVLVDVRDLDAFIEARKRGCSQDIQSRAPQIEPEKTGLNRGAVPTVCPPLEGR